MNPSRTLPQAARQTIKFLCTTVLSACFLLMGSDSAIAQVSLGSSPYVEDFDGIGSGLPSGWAVHSGANASALGTAGTYSTAATAWNSTAGNFRNSASADGLTSGASTAAQNGSADRALGVRQSGSNGDPGAAFVVQLANTNGLSDFQLDFKLQSLDIGSPRTTTWTVDYALGTATNFTSVATTPTTLTTGGSSFTNTDVTVDFGGALDNASGPVWIRIVTLTSTSGSGNRATTGIDDFTLSWGAGMPLLGATETALAFGPVLYGTSSAPQSVDVSGLNLSPADDELTVAVPADFEVSLDAGGPWTASVALPYTGDALASTPVWVRFSPAAVGVQAGDLTINGGSADEVTVALSGVGATNTPGTIYLHNFGTTPTNGQPYTVAPNTLDPNLDNSVWTNNNANSWSLLSGTLSRGVNTGTHDYTLALDVADGYLAEITGFSFWSRSATANGPSDWSLAINGITVGNGTIPVATGASTGTLQVSATRTNLADPLIAVLTLTGASSNVTFQLDDFELLGSVYPGTDPFLTATETALPLFGAQVINTPSGTQSFSVTGMNLSPAAGDITVTAPAGTDFQVSTDASPTWASSVTLPYTGEALAATAVHVRFLPASLGLQSGDITITGGDADPLSVSVSGQGLERTPSTLYLHNFGTGIINTHPYTVSPLATPVPGVLEAHLGNSSWTNSDGSWGQASGATGNGIRIFTSAGAETVSLSLDVANGYAVEISDFDFWVQRAAAGQDWSMTIEGIAVGSGSITGTSGAYIGQTPVANPVLVTDGQVNVEITWVNGSGNAGLTMDDFTLRGALIAQGTAVQFASTSSTVSESAGTASLTVGILEPDATNATTVDVVLVSGDAARIGGYTTQTVTFPAGSSADQTLPITITDNADCDDGDAVLVFELQNVGGGQGTPFVDLNGSYTLTVENDDTSVDPVATAGTDILGDGFTANWNPVNGATGYFLDVYAGATSVEEDFADGDFTADPAWTGSTGSYAVLTSATLPNGSASTDGFFLGSNASVGSSALLMPSTEVQEWKFSLGSTNFSPAATNNFGVVLMADASITDISDPFNGYYLNIGANGSNDRIELWRSSGTTKTQVGEYTAGPSVSGAIGGGLNIRVTRSAAGEFELFHAAGFTYAATPATSAGILTDNTHGASIHFGVFTDFTSPTTSRRVYIDNIVLGGAMEFIPGYDNLPVAGISQAVTGLDPLTTYYYRVRSAGGCSTGNNSNAIEVTTTAGTSPSLTAGTLADFGTLCEGASSAPQSFTLDGFNLTTADVTVGALAGYAYSTTEAGTYTATLSIPQGGGSFTQDIWVVFTPAAAGNHDGDIAVGGGGATGITVAVTGSGIDTPSEVSTGTASQTGDDSAEAFGSIDVEGCSATTAYGIEYSTTQGFTPGTGTQVAASNLSGGGFSSALTGLALCTDHYFRAYLTNAQGTLYGAEESFLNTDISAPVATAATGTGVDAFTANWDAVPGATGYFLDVSTSPTFGTPLSNSTFTTGFDQGRANLPAGWSHSGLGTDYGSDGGVATPSLKFDDSNDQLVSATFAGPATSISFWYKGQGTNSSASTLLTEGYNGSTWETIGQLTGIASSATGTETYTLDQGDGYVQFRFTYTKVTGNLAFDDFSVNYLSGNPDFLSGYEAFPVTGTSHEVAGLDPGTTYYYRVRANSGCGTSLNSDVISTTTLVPGCTDPLAENYDPGAVPDNGSCTYCDPVFTYNTPTPTPITIGSGIPDQHMAVGSDCHNFQIGMTAYERYVPGGIIPVGNVYTTTVGYSPTSPGNPTPDPNNARWNFLVSIDLGTYDFTEVNVFLDMDFDPGATPVFQEVDISALAAAQGQQNTSVQQQAQNLKSAFWSLLFPGVSFDATVPGLYDLRVRLESPTTGAELMSHTIQVEVLAPGCTDPLADNYSSEASTDDGSCIYCPPTITYDTPTPTPIVIGSGIPDQHMAVSQDCRGIDVALSAFERYVGELIPAGNVYTTTVGNSPVSGGDPTPDPVLARWNLLGSVDLGSYDFTEVNVFLDLDFDPGATPVWQSMNLSQAMIDNSMGNLHVYQASENLAAPFWTIAFPGITFDPHVPGIYDVRVRLESVHSSEELVSMAIQVVVEDPEVTYYSQASGDVSDPIWDVVPVGTPGPATFTASTSMVVQGTHAVVNSTSTEVEDLAVETGGSLTLGAGSSLQVHGSEARFDGALAAADLSTLALLGSEATILESSGGDLDLWNLTVNTPAGTLTDATLRVRGTLQLDGGTFDATLADVTLASSATGTGRLGPVASGASYAGDLTVQRYIPAGHTNWRMLGSPVAGQTVNDWKDDFFTAGFPGSHYPNFYNPVGSGILWPSIRYYDETVVSTNADDGLAGATSNTMPLGTGQGFQAWSGDNFSTTTAFTVDVTGAPHIADSPIALPVSFTASGSETADGWNLVSNPLPSPIDFTLLSRGADVRNAYWIFDPVAGNLKAWTNGMGQGSLNGILQSSQGFYLKSDGAAVTTTVSESAKVEEPLGGTFGGSQDPAWPVLTFTLNSALNTYSDEATIVFADGTPDYDASDALKLNFKAIGAPQVSILSNDGQRLAVDFFGAYASAVQIPLLVNADTTGTYTITAGMAGINTLSCLSLLDLQTGTVTALTDGAAYSFTIHADDDPATPRFLLNGSAPLPFFVDQALCSDALGAGTVVVDEGPVDIQWTDAFGNLLLEMTGVEGGIAEFQAPAGNYMVQVTPGGACGELVGQFTITAPAALETTSETSPTTCPNGTDGTAAVEVLGGTAPYTYLWSDGSTADHIIGSAGAYTVTITDAAGCTEEAGLTVPAGEGTIAGFTLNGNTPVAHTPVTFTNTSVLGADYLWDFGDGATSTDEHATHTYTEPGTYTVTLTATGGDCSDVFTLELTVDATTAVEAITPGSPLAVWATPDHIVIAHSFNNAPVDVDVYDATGRLAISRGSLVQPGRILIDGRSLNTGVWFVRVTSGDAERTFRVPLMR